MIKNFSTSFTLVLFMLDILATVIALWLAEVLRLHIDLGHFATEEIFHTPSIFYIVIPLIWLTILQALQAYSPIKTYRAVLEITTIIKGFFVAGFVISGFLYLVFRNYSRLQAFYLIFLMAVLTIGLRGFLRLYFRAIGGRNYDSRRILVIGTTKLAEHMGRQVRSFAWTGLFLVGFIDADEPDDDTNKEALPIVGHIEQLHTLIQELQVNEVIFALRRPEYGKLTAFINSIYQQQVNVRLTPDVEDFTYLSVTVESINGMPLISLREPIMTPAERMFKRVFDTVVCALALIFVLPLMAIIALAIRLESKGSPIFKQKRVGENRRIFTMYKFRTMIQEAEDLQDAISRLDENGKIIHKMPDDPRVTRVGRFLRRTSLDELPQIINILKGDMSLVGPRPEIPWLVDNYETWQLRRFSVPQGLTGWWQINGRAETLMHLAIEDDLYYILNYSITLDLLILLRTPFAVLGGRGAY